MPVYANLNEVLGALANFGFQGLKEEDLGRMCGVDSHEEELAVMAETSAYFHIAYKVGPFPPYICFCTYTSLLSALSTTSLAS